MLREISQPGTNIFRRRTENFFDEFCRTDSRS
jgi:hypothetical protein